MLERVQLLKKFLGIKGLWYSYPSGCSSYAVSVYIGRSREIDGIRLSCEAPPRHLNRRKPPFEETVRPYLCTCTQTRSMSRLLPSTSMAAISPVGSLKSSRVGWRRAGWISIRSSVAHNTCSIPRSVANFVEETGSRPGSRNTLRNSARSFWWVTARYVPLGERYMAS